MKRMLVGSRDDLAGTVYGTIVVLAVLAAAGRPDSGDSWALAEAVIVTTLVLWAGHVYAHGLGESVKLGRRLDRKELRGVARREAAIPLAALMPCVALIAGALGWLRESSAIWVAFGLGIAALGASGLRYARLEGLTTTMTVLVVAANLAIGIALVALKIAVTH